MQCENCAYNFVEPNDAVCRRCGRFTENKVVELAFVIFSAAAFGLLSHYVLTGRLYGGSRLVWLFRALTVPGSIYESTSYMLGVALAIAGVLAIPTLVSFHYGPGWGLLAGVIAGVTTGIHLGVIIIVLMVMVAGVPRLRGVSAAIWPVTAALLGVLYLGYQWVEYAPKRALLYREALGLFLLGTGAVLVALVWAEASWSLRCKGRSAHVAPAAVLLAGVAAWLSFSGYFPSELKANELLTIYDFRGALNADLPQGFVAGLSTSDDEGLSPEKQLGNLFATLEAVDERRAVALSACDEYLRSYGKARAAAGVLVVKAKMQSAKVDLGLLKRFNRLETYFDRVGPDADETYVEIITRFEGSREAALAWHHHAEGSFQAGQVSAARALFAKAEKALEGVVRADYEPTAVSEPESVGELFEEGKRRETRFAVKLYEALMATRRRLSLIEHNLDYGGQPLARLAGLDERSEDFEQDAASLLANYKESRLSDNIKLILAEHLSDPVERLNALDQLLDKEPNSDVRDRMLLGAAKAHLAGSIRGGGRREAELLLRRLLADYPESTYAREASRLLSGVTGTAR